MAFNDTQEEMLQNELTIVRLFAAPSFEGLDEDPEFEVVEHSVPNFVIWRAKGLYLLPERQEGDMIVAQAKKGDRLGIVFYQPDMEPRPKVAIDYRSKVCDRNQMVPLIDGEFPEFVYTSDGQWTAIMNKMRMDKPYVITEETPIHVSDQSHDCNLDLRVLGTENITPAEPTIRARGTMLGTPVPTHKALEQTSKCRLSGRKYPLQYRIETI